MWDAIRCAEKEHLKGFRITKGQAYELLQACAKEHAKDIQPIRRIQSLIIFSELGSIEILCNHLIRLFVSSQSILEATFVFNIVSKPSVYTWSSIISAYADFGLSSIAIQLYYQAILDGFDTNKCICLAGLKACVASSMASITYVMLIHHVIMEKSYLYHDVMVGNALIHVYTKCGIGSLEDAYKVFVGLAYRTIVSWNAMVAGYAQFGDMDLAMKCFKDMKRDGITPNLISWGSIIAGYAHNGTGSLALDCYISMQKERISLDKVVFSSALQACGSISSLNEGRLIHFQIVEMNLYPVRELGTALVDMYSKCGNLEDAKNVLTKFSVREVGPWNALISGYARHGNLDLALQGLKDMQKDGIKPDVITWTAIIGGLVQNDDGLLAMDCFRKMEEEGITPNAHTYSNILKACGIMCASEDGMVIHDQLMKSGIQNPVVGNTLVDMYARCGNTRESHKLLTKLQFRNVVSWGALIEGYSNSGNVNLALQCFHDMQDDGIKPNGAIFVCILTACSHSGLVDEGYKYFNLMQYDYNIMPTIHHHICMVDLLARTGHLKEAENVFLALNVNHNGCRILLTAGRTFGNLDLGKRCFERVQQKDNLDTSECFLMPDVYSDGSTLRCFNKMQELRLCGNV